MPMKKCIELLIPLFIYFKILKHDNGFTTFRKKIEKKKSSTCKLRLYNNDFDDHTNDPQKTRVVSGSMSNTSGKNNI